MKKTQIVALLVLGFFVPALCYASAPAQSLNMMPMLSGLLGGLALFLYGMNKITEGFKAVSSSGLKSLLGLLTRNRFIGCLVGAVLTVIVQSSSVTTVLVVGFVSAGLMTLSQSVGVIMGANIGTTITAQIIAFKVTHLALLMMAAGFLSSITFQNDKAKQVGASVLGLGMVFFGMSVMSEGMYPLRGYEPFTDILWHMSSPILGILAGAIFTGVIQSSAGTIGIVIVLASQGMMTLEAGIAVAIGANIGTCVTALFASFGKTRPAVRAAIVHILFNVIGALIWIGFIKELSSLAVFMSPGSSLGGLNPDIVPRQIVNANTVFNIANTIIFIGFAPLFAKAAEWLVKDVESKGDSDFVIKPQFLDPGLIDTPSVALEMVALEIKHMSQLVAEMLSSAKTAAHKLDRAAMRDIDKIDNQIDYLFAEINQYMSQIGRGQLDEDQSERFFVLFQTAGIIESLGDTMDRELSSLIDRMITGNVLPSTETATLINRMHNKVVDALDCAMGAVVRRDKAAAQQVLDMKDSFRELLDLATRRQSRSLIESTGDRFEILRIEFEMVGKYKQAYNMLKRCAVIAMQGSEANMSTGFSGEKG